MISILKQEQPDKDLTVQETQYRIYADGTVVHEDDFEEYDHMQPYSDDYRTVSVPDEVIEYISESCSDFLAAS
jgi:hypothetical protein